MEQHYKAHWASRDQCSEGGFLRLGRVSSFSDELENHVANDQSDQKNGYSYYKDAFGL
jgi:hypothetical protein